MDETRTRVAERYPDAEMLGFDSATTYLINLEGVVRVVDLRTLEIIDTEKP